MNPARAKARHARHCERLFTELVECLLQGTAMVFTATQFLEVLLYSTVEVSRSADVGLPGMDIAYCIHVASELHPASLALPQRCGYHFRCIGVFDAMTRCSNRPGRSFFRNHLVGLPSMFDTRRKEKENVPQGTRRARYASRSPLAG